MKKRVNHPNQRNVDLQNSASSKYASETIVRHGAEVEVIDTENEYSRVSIQVKDEEDRVGYILTEYLEDIE